MKRRPTTLITLRNNLEAIHHEFRAGGACLARNGLPENNGRECFILCPQLLMTMTFQLEAWQHSYHLSYQLHLFSRFSSNFQGSRFSPPHSVSQKTQLWKQPWVTSPIIHPRFWHFSAAVLVGVDLALVSLSKHHLHKFKQNKIIPCYYNSQRVSREMVFPQ